MVTSVPEHAASVEWDEFTNDAGPSVVAYWFVLMNVQTPALRPVHHVPGNAKTGATIAIVKKRVASHACRVARRACGNVVITSVRGCVESYATGQDVTNRAIKPWFVEEAAIFVAVCVENCASALFAKRMMIVQLQRSSSARKMRTIRFSFNFQTANTFLQWQVWTGKNFIIRTVNLIVSRRHCPAAVVTLPLLVNPECYNYCRFRNVLMMSKNLMRNVQSVIFAEF